MRILIVASQTEVGGTECFTVSLIDHFVERKIECDLFVIRKASGILEGKLHSKINIGYGGFGGFLDIRFLIKLRKWLRRQPPDVVLCQSIFTYLSLKISSIFIKKLRIFMALHYTRKSGMKNCFLQHLTFLIFRISESDRIIAIYRKQIDLFCRRFHLNPKRFLLIHNGIKLQSIQSDEYKSDVLRLIHVANHRPEKDQWTLLQSLAYLNKEYQNWEMTWVGSIPEKIRTEYNEFIIENHFEDKLFFADFIENVPQMLRGKDVFVLTSISEALPVSALEAMSAGLCCILTDVGGCSELITSGKEGFLVPPNRSDLILEKILLLISNPGILEDMKLRARKKAVEEFDIEKITEKYINAFIDKKGIEE